MTTIEILATIVAVLTLVKIIIVIIQPRVWMKLVGPLYRNPRATTFVYLVLAVITGYYVLQSISIIELGAATLFLVFLMGIGFLPYADTLLKLRDEVIKKGIKSAWLAILVWIVFALWVLYAVLA